MYFKQLEYILKVAECQNITKAAEKLYMSQPALSSFIQKTETELNTKIFDRTTTPITLTQAGEIYVKTARKILALHDNLQNDIKDLNNCREGIIKIGLSDMRATSILPYLLPLFKRLYPNITIQTVESSSKHVEENVKSGIVDIGILPLFQVDPAFQTKVAYEEEILLISGDTLPSKPGPIHDWVSLETLNERDFILMGEKSRIRQAIDAIFLEHGVKPRSIIESSNHMTLFLTATTGMALTMVPESITRIMNPIKIPKIYSLGKKGFRWNIGAIWRPDMELTSPQKQLIKILRTNF